MVIFAKRKVELAIFEVGLGGRLDATNVIDPVVSVITTISYDHQAVLGNTLTQIAGEKAGIIKPDTPVISANQTGEALDEIIRVAGEKSAPMKIVSRDIFYAPKEHSLDGQTFWLWSPEQQPKMDLFLENGPEADWKPDTYHVPLLGAHQLENAATAYLTIQQVKEAGFQVPDEAIRQGFKNVVWQCRFEVVSRSPIIVLDSAHNRDSAQKLRITLDDYLPGKEIVLLFGASEDKDVKGMLTDLLPRVDQIIATQTTHPRAMEASSIVQLVHQMGKPARAVIPFEIAYHQAVDMASAGRVLLVTGSIFMAAAAREVWMKTSGYQIRNNDAN